MKLNFYKTDLGIVVEDNNSIRLKSCFEKIILTKEQLENSNPIKISKHKYSEELNIFFKNTKHEWCYDGVWYKKLDNFEMGKWSVENYNLLKDIPLHDIGKSYLGSCIIVLYQGRIYYTFFNGNYTPQMQLIDFKTKQLTGKWTNIKNLAPVFNKNTKKIM
jgi:hypothetical protein